jgi:hypothetical protein
VGTTTDDSQEEHGKHEKEAEPSFWASFNRTDAKLLVVTIVGTLAANVVTVMVVAVAIIVVGASRSRPSSDLVYTTLLDTVLGILVTGFLVSSFRRARGGFKVIRAVIAIMSGLFTVQLLLILLGYAANIK